MKQSGYSDGYGSHYQKFEESISSNYLKQSNCVENYLSGVTKGQFCPVRVRVTKIQISHGSQKLRGETKTGEQRNVTCELCADVSCFGSCMLRFSRTNQVVFFYLINDKSVWILSGDVSEKKVLLRTLSKNVHKKKVRQTTEKK